MALEVAVDRRCSPLAAERGVNAVTIEASRDGARRPPRSVFAEDASNDIGLNLIDFAQAAHWLAAIVELLHDPVAVGETAG